MSRCITTNVIQDSTDVFKHQIFCSRFISLEDSGGDFTVFFKRPIAKGFPNFMEYRKVWLRAAQQANDRGQRWTVRGIGNCHMERDVGFCQDSCPTGLCIIG